MVPRLPRLEQCDGKYAHPTQAQAQEWARLASRQFNCAMDAYHCPHCGCWHTTSLKEPARHRMRGRKRKTPMPPYEPEPELSVPALTDAELQDVRERYAGLDPEVGRALQELALWRELNRQEVEPEG